MNKKDTPNTRQIFNIRQRGEEIINKVQTAMKYEENITEISTIEEMIIDMKEELQKAICINFRYHKKELKQKKT